jgi:hypothetical protein
LRKGRDSIRVHVAGFGYLLLSQRKYGILSVGNQEEDAMKEKKDVPQGTLALMVLKRLHGLDRCGRGGPATNRKEIQRSTKAAAAQ